MHNKFPEFTHSCPDVSPEIIQQAKKVRFLVLDVDGVCTDGKLHIDSSGETSKNFHVFDGIGIKTAIYAGINVGIITGREDPCVEARMRPLGVCEYHAGHLSKLGALHVIAERQKVGLDEMAYMGDDWIDLDPLCRVGFPIAVANARPEVKQVALYVTQTRGGEGAVREAVEFLLACRGGPAPATYWVHQDSE